MYDFHVPTSSARSVNSSGLSQTVTSGYPSDPVGLRTFQVPKPSLKCHTSGARRLPTCINSLSTMFCMKPSPSSCWFASNFNALIRFPQKPWRTACALESSGDLGLVNTFACLHKSLYGCFQPFFSTNRAPPIITPFSPRDPPNVAFHRETVTMRAQV